MDRQGALKWNGYIYGRTFVDIRSVERLQSEFSDVVDMEKKVEAYRSELERLEEKYEQACEDLRHTIELYDYALRYKDTVRVLFVRLTCGASSWRPRQESF